ncbi:MAG TPA: choline dehydrogenase, partial [Gammaproteobacteria bacterium]|nr:choline dehydrogenase [Gammaproteobacteria bacterium]
DYDGKDQHRGHGFQVHVGPMKPSSRGTVKLRSSDPKISPVVRFNYNESERDREVMRRGIRIARRIVRQSPFDAYRGTELRPGSSVDSDRGLDAFIQQYAESAYHPSCTCRMGVDEGAVVNQRGLVNGVSGLRIVDASIMPEITNGNLNAVVIMMAEKISELIRQSN